MPGEKVLSAYVEVTADEKPAVESARKMGATIKQELTDATEAGENAMQVMVGRMGVSFESIEHAASHALGGIGREMMMGGLLGVGITMATEGAIELGKKFFEAGSEAEEAARKSAESFAKLNEAITENVKSVKELVEEMHEASKLKLDEHKQSASDFVSKAADATKPESPTGHFEKAQRELHEKAGDIDKQQKETDQEIAERKKHIAELTKKQEELAHQSIKALADHAKETPEPEVKTNRAGSWNAMIEGPEEAESRRKHDEWIAQRELLEQRYLDAQKQIAAEKEQEQQQLGHLTATHSALSQADEQLRKHAQEQLKHAQDLDKAAKDQVEAKKKAAEAEKKEADRRVQGQAMLDRDVQREADIKTRMATLTKEINDHPTQFVGLENLGQSIQGGLGKKDEMAGKLEELKKLQAEANRLHAQEVELLKGRLPKENTTHAAVFGSGGH